MSIFGQYIQPIINQFALAACEIDGYPIDAVVSEGHAFENDVTTYPVETGVDITDHVRLKPLKITMEGIVSDTPLGQIANHPTRAQGLPSDTSYAKLLRIRDSQEPVTIITSLGVYKNMVMSSFSVPRESGEPHQLHFKAEFTQVQIVTNQRRVVRTSTPGGQGKQQLGEKLAKLGFANVQVFTLKKADPRKPVYPLILTDSNGDRHYMVSFGSPKADGWVGTAAGSSVVKYYPYLGFFGMHFDAASGQWLDAQGKPLCKKPPKALDNNGYNLVGHYTATRL